MVALLASFLSDNGKQFCSKLSAAVFELLKVRITLLALITLAVTVVLSASITLFAQMLAMVVNERLDNWDEHLPQDEFAHDNSVSAATH